MSMDKSDVRYTAGKIFFSLGAILFALLSFFLANKTPYFAFLVSGLALCSLGDLLLALSGERKKTANPVLFLAGALSFALTHILFCLYFLYLSSFHVSFFLLLSPLTSLFLFLLVKGKQIDGGKLTPFLYIYGLFVGMLLGLGANLLFLDPGYGKALLLFLGSFFFWVSDSILSFRSFGRKERKFLTPLILVFYFLAIYLLAGSVLA